MSPALVVVAAAPIHILTLSLLHPTHAGFLLLLDGALGFLALGLTVANAPSSVPAPGDTRRAEVAILPAPSMP